MLVATLIAALLQTVQEVNALTEVDYARQRGFSLFGNVIASSSTGMFVLDDGTGRAHFHYLDSYKPVPGDRIHVLGHAWSGNDRFNHLVPTNVVRLGTAEIPAPQATTLSAINRGECDLLPVTVRGLVTDIHPDELEANGVLLTLQDGTDVLVIPLHDNPKLPTLLGAEVSATGLCRPQSLGWRLFASRCLDTSLPCITVLTPAPSDRFSVPSLGDPHRITPQALAGLGYRHVTGIVRAAWQKNRVLVETGTGYGHHVTALLTDPTALPDIGSRVRVAGLPETDLFSVTLNNAVCRPEPGILPTEPRPTDMTVCDLLGTTNRILGLNASYHGRLVRLTGLVGPLSTADAAAHRFPLITSDGMIVVDASGVKAPSSLPEPESHIAVTGVAILETEPWRAFARFPSVKGFSIVMRTSDDIDVLARPPWWTTGRLVAALCALFAVLVGILVWNRALNRLVERRSRELLRERSAHENADLKLEERTRLAVELHDSLSQNLEGVACQVSATRGVLTAAPDAVGPCLDTAERMLGSCRTELRRCLFDLRGDALEAKDLTEALHRTLDPLALRTELNIDCPVRTSGFDDAQVHAILCIIRELVTNAVRHGQAKHVRVSGAVATDTLSLAVDDDGCGFDPEHRPGPDEGHFGLQGVHDRLRRLNGTFSVRSKSGGPTVITVTIPIAA